jgi:hypothetical protein
MLKKTIKNLLHRQTKTLQKKPVEIDLTFLCTHNEMFQAYQMMLLLPIQTPVSYELNWVTLKLARKLISGGELWI